MSILKLGLKSGMKSKLKEVVDNIPDGTSIKQESLKNYLKDKQVKAEEIKYSQFKVDGKGKITKDEMVKQLDNREDKFKVEPTRNRFKSYSMPNGKVNPTYREKVLTYKNEPDKDNDYLSPHFSNPNYLAHTRVYDDRLNGLRSRILQEIQSDLHQDAKKIGGYFEDGATKTQSLSDIEYYLKELRNKYETQEETAKLVGHQNFFSDHLWIEEFGKSKMSEKDIKTANALFKAKKDLRNLQAEYVDKGPLSDNWLKKGIERELVDAINDGMEQLSIPIKGPGTEHLVRADGVQTWYETQVLNTAKRVANSANAEFTVTKELKKPLSDLKLSVERMSKEERLDYADKLIGRWGTYSNLDTFDDINAGNKFINEFYSDKTMDALDANDAEALVKSMEEEIDKHYLTYANIKPASITEPVEKHIDRYESAASSMKVTEANIEKAATKNINKLNRLADLAEKDLMAQMKRDGYDTGGDFINIRDAADYVDSEHATLEGMMYYKDFVSARDDLDAMYSGDPEEINKVLNVVDPDHPKLSEVYSKQKEELLDAKRPVSKQVYAKHTAKLARKRADELITKIEKDKNTFKELKGIEVVDGDYTELLKAARELPMDDAYPLIDKIKEFQDMEHLANKNLNLSKEPIVQNKNVEFYLYSSPAAGGFAYYNAYKEGRSEEEIDEFMFMEGVTREEILEYKKAADAISKAKEGGATDEDINAFFDEEYKAAETAEIKLPEYMTSDAVNRWATGNSLSPKTEALESLISEEAVSAKKLVAQMNTVFPTLTSNLTDVASYFGSEDARLRHDKARVSSRNKLIALMKNQYGIDLEWTPGKGQWEEKWEFVNKNGDIEEITPGFWESLSEYTDETLGGIGGMIAGAAATPPVLPVVGPLAKPIGGAIGGLVGAVVGSQLDYMRTAHELLVEHEAEAMLYKAMNAAEMAVVGEALGWGFIGAGRLTAKAYMHVKDLILDRNTNGAFEYLKETTGYSDEQLYELVDRLSQVMVVPGKNKKEQAMSAVSISETGMQDLSKAAGAVNPISTLNLTRFIDDRAKSVLKAAEDISTPNSSIRFMKDLYNYTGDVKDQYKKVKIRAANSPKANNFAFDYDSLAIDPILDKLESKILNPAVLDRFLLQAKRVRSMTNSRTFADLIELRQITNEFLFNGKITKYDDKATLRGVVDGIDGMIEQGAEQVLDDPKTWLDDWKVAKSDYSAMKKTEQTAMYRLMFDKKGKPKAVKPEAVTKAMTKYLTTLDGNFDLMLDKLPPQSRQMYEGAIIENLTNKFTVGYRSENQAVHFPALADELEKLSFKSPQAREMKDALLEMSELFKNDLPLAMTSANFRPQPFQSYLTADPFVRAKFALASEVFNYVGTLAPSDKSKSNALIHKTAKLLEKPLNAKLANELIEEFRQDPDMLKMISTMQRDAAWARAKGRDTVMPIVHIFEGGKYKGVGEPVTKIGRHRIASEEVVKQIADSEAVSVGSKTLDRILKQHGYAAIENGTDRVRLLK